MGTHHVIEIDIVDSDGTGSIAHVYIDGIVNDDGSRAIVSARKPIRDDAYTLGEYGEPTIEGRNWSALARAIARHYGLSGSVRIENEITNSVKVFTV